MTTSRIAVLALALASCQTELTHTPAVSPGAIGPAATAAIDDYPDHGYVVVGSPGEELLTVYKRSSEREATYEVAGQAWCMDCTDPGCATNERTLSLDLRHTGGEEVLQETLTSRSRNFSNPEIFSFVPTSGEVTTIQIRGTLQTCDAFSYWFDVVDAVDLDNDGFSASVDCDDDDPAVHPGASEICNGKDDDCVNGMDDADPNVDLSTADAYFTDGDGDGYGDADRVTLSCEPVLNTSAEGTDCDDDDPAIHPGVTDGCDGIDNDCDGVTDPWQTWDATGLARGRQIDTVDVPWAGGTTWSFWVKPNATVSEWGSIFHVGSSNDARRPAVWFHPGSTRLHLRSSTTANWNEGTDSSGTLPIGVWSHVAMVIEDDRVTAYVDGASVGQADFAGTPSRSVGPLYVSDPWYRASNADFGGLSVSCTALSPEEVQRAAAQAAGTSWPPAP